MTVKDCEVMQCSQGMDGGVTEWWHWGSMDLGDSTALSIWVRRAGAGWPKKAPVSSYILATCQWKGSSGEVEKNFEWAVKLKGLKLSD